jgi:hypothetical protein
VLQRFKIDVVHLTRGIIGLGIICFYIKDVNYIIIKEMVEERQEYA